MRADELMHQPVRARIMAALVALDTNDQLDFTRLRDLLGATDGNLGAHLLRLEEGGCVRVEKTFVGRKPRTFLSATVKGRAAFAEYVESLKGAVARSEKRLVRRTRHAASSGKGA